MSKRLLVLVIAVALPLIPIVGLIRQSSSGLASITDRAAQLEPMSSAQLRELSSGEDALIEGIIDARTPVQLQSLVAYERQYSLVDNDLGRYWRTDEQVASPLWIALADGQTVHVLNSTYQLRHPVSTWEPPASTTRYLGLKVGDRVTAVGTLLITADGFALNAHTVAGGSRAEWLADEQGVGTATLDGLLVAGITLSVVALAAWWLAQHRPHRIAPTGV